MEKSISMNMDNPSSFQHPHRIRRDNPGLKCILANLLTGLILLIMLPAVSFSQEVPRVRIFGRVIDASTQKPLHFANVFLSNTTKGSATDEDGIFDIVNVPLGTYELIVSVMGYELQTRTIDLTKPLEKEFNFSLKSKPIEAPEINVTAEIPKEWKKHLGIFERYFLGLSSNASKCKILNPEVLDFEYDDEKN